MRKLCVYLLILTMVVSLSGCKAKPAPEATEPSPTMAATVPTETKPTTQPETENQIGQLDTYWVATQCYNEDTGETQKLQPDAWMMDLMLCLDGTARFRDVREGLCLVDDSLLHLNWEQTTEDAYVFYSRLRTEPILQAAWEQGILTLRYYELTVTMEARDMPEAVGQRCSPAELAGTWLQVSGETEGWQWEAMPERLSSLVFRVTAYEGPLELRADMETLDHFGTMTEGLHDQQVSILQEALYDGCENNSWSVRIGQEAARNEEGDPTETEVYATLLDERTLLVQQVYTLDGAPAVSYQTYLRFPELVTWCAPEYYALDYSNWACTSYITFQGEERCPPEEMENFSLVLCPDQSCVISYGDAQTFRGTWQLENGGVLLLRGDEDAFWFGGAISMYSVESANGVSDVYDLSLYYGGGILKLEITGFG